MHLISKIIKFSWEKETCYPTLQNEWNINNPSLGQCAITALAVNDYFGGKIMRCMCDGISHYYNMINDEIFDLTVAQFNDVVPDYQNGEERPREYLLSNADTVKRYKILLQNMKNNFLKYGSFFYKLRDINNQIYESKIPGTYGGHKKLKIYGKMDCPSALRWIKKGYYVNERVFFLDEETAINAGYRPCSICMPQEYGEWKTKEHVKRLEQKNTTDARKIQ